LSARVQNYRGKVFQGNPKVNSSVHALFFYSDRHDDDDDISLKSSRNIVSALSVPLKYARPL
jgi:hypothetical protein